MAYIFDFHAAAQLLRDISLSRASKPTSSISLFTSHTHYTHALPLALNASKAEVISQPAATLATALMTGQEMIRHFHLASMAALQELLIYTASSRFLIEAFCARPLFSEYFRMPERSFRAAAAASRASQTRPGQDMPFTF